MSKRALVVFQIIFCEVLTLPETFYIRQPATEIPSNWISFALFKTIVSEDHDTLYHLSFYTQTMDSIIGQPLIPFLPYQRTEQTLSTLPVKVHQ